jgi:hypothetical protein
VDVVGVVSCHQEVGLVEGLGVGDTNFDDELAIRVDVSAGVNITIFKNNFGTKLAEKIGYFV